MTTPEAAALADALDRAIVYTSQSHDGAVTVLPVETARNLIAYLEVAGYALTPLAPEVPPRRDGLRERIAALRPWPEGEAVIQSLERLADTVLPVAATRTPEPPARRIRPQGTITHQHNGWHDHPLVDLGDATAATEPHVHRRGAEPPDSGDGAARALHEGIEERLTMQSDPFSRRESIHAYIDAWLDSQRDAGIDAALLAQALHNTGECENWSPGYRSLGPAPDYERLLDVEGDSAAHLRSARKVAREYARLRSGSPAPEGGAE